MRLHISIISVCLILSYHINTAADFDRQAFFSSISRSLGNKSGFTSSEIVFVKIVKNITKDNTSGQSRYVENQEDDDSTSASDRSNADIDRKIDEYLNDDQT
jgi:hypothetical protein